MKYATIDDARRPTGFYESEVHGDAIPEGAVEITEEQWRQLVDAPSTVTVAGGKVTTIEHIEPTEEEATSAAVAEVEAAAMAARLQAMGTSDPLQIIEEMMAADEARKAPKPTKEQQEAIAADDARRSAVLAARTKRVKAVDTVKKADPADRKTVAAEAAADLKP